MAKAIVTLKIMPESPDVNLDDVLAKANQAIGTYCGETETKSETQAVAFGLKALQIMFVMDEAKGSTEPLEQAIAHIDGVNSIEVVDVRRALG